MMQYYTLHEGGIWRPVPLPLTHAEMIAMMYPHRTDGAVLFANGLIYDNCLACRGYTPWRDGKLALEVLDSITNSARKHIDTGYGKHARFQP